MLSKNIKNKVTKTPNGFIVEENPNKVKAKGNNQLDRIEAKLDLLLEEKGIEIS